MEEPLTGYLAGFRSPAASWGNDREKPNKPSQNETGILLGWAMRVTGKILGVDRVTYIAQEVQDWLSQADTDDDPYNAIFWTILAVGAQSFPEDKDEAAESQANEQKSKSVPVF